MITILYGKNSHYVDVTEKVFSGDITNIPASDSDRLNIFKSDPVIGVEKDVVIIKDGEIKTFDTKNHIQIDFTGFIPSYQKLLNLHESLNFKHGSMKEEFPEQSLTIKYLSSNARVLELGANVGRNTMVIASILNDQKNLVSLETSLDSVKKLTENRDINNFTFFIEPSALSKRKLIQRGWDTIPSDIVLDGYFEVNIIAYENLEKKYNITFDTIVADCEGALYYILQDDPEILKNINTVIVENDYHHIKHKEFVDSVFKSNGLSVIHQEAGGWGPCENFFFEVWKRL
jgi:hypothetical protein